MTQIKCFDEISHNVEPPANVCPITQLNRDRIVCGSTGANDAFKHIRRKFQLAGRSLPRLQRAQPTESYKLSNWLIVLAVRIAPKR